jgi:hypothetical protein
MRHCADIIEKHSANVKHASAHGAGTMALDVVHPPKEVRENAQIFPKRKRRDWQERLLQGGMKERIGVMTSTTTFLRDVSIDRKEILWVNLKCRQRLVLIENPFE